MFTETLVHGLALIGLVILVASLFSGVVDRTGIPQVAIFLVVGALLGPSGLGLVQLTLESHTVQVLATVALVLVLFTDAISVDMRELREHGRTAAVVLGPGTLIPAAIIGVSAWQLLDLSPLLSAILGAALASTDPVLLRSFLRRPSLSRATRQVLRMESGMNDVVLLPIIVMSIIILGFTGENLAAELAEHAVGLFLLGPALGALAGFIAITLLDRVRSRLGVRRDYESLYALGVALSAFAAAESVGGSGFLAAFTAGLVIASLDVELCDCFVDFGQATAEMFLLFTFVAFGAGLIWSGLQVANGPVLLFALIGLFARTLVLLPVLGWAGVERRDRWLIAWFGPRGLSSLLLILLPVFAGVTGSELLFAITSLVVLLSVVLHGLGIAVYVRKEERFERAVAAPRAGGAAPAADGAAPGGARVPERITIVELRELQSSGEPVILGDVRTGGSYYTSELKAQGALRLEPDEAVRRARDLGLDQRATIALYCT